MTRMNRFTVMTAMLTVPAVLAFSQEAPVTPLPPPAKREPAAARPWPPPRVGAPEAVRPEVWGQQPAMPLEPPDASDWPTPAIAPMAEIYALDAWESIPAIAPVPAMPPMAAMRALGAIDAWQSVPALAPLAPIPPMGSMNWAPPRALALLAWNNDESQDQEEDRRARDDARRAQDQERRAQDEERRAQEEMRRAAERDDNSYRKGKAFLDRKSYDQAIEAFNRVIEDKTGRADGALYWRAYALNRLGKRDEALASLSELQKNYPKSRWLDDAKALDVEVRQKSGQSVSPDSTGDEELKLMALQGLAESDPERSVPMLEKVLKSNNSPRLKERALFVLAQSHGQKSREILASVAKGGSNPDLQSKAIEYLGIYGGHENLQILVDVYKTSGDAHVKRAILNSFMVSGSRDNLLAVAKSESNPELKVQAIQLLGNAGGSADLAQLYSAESSVQVKRAIINGLFVSGNSDKLFDLAKNEKDPSLRHFAINQLGVMGRSKTGQSLAGMYPTETDLENKKAIINALFVQGNAAAMVEIARKETDMNLKKFVVNQLAVMHSKEATDFMMEILSK